MSDIVERLRITHFMDGHELGMTTQRAEAADEIDSLRAQLAAAEAKVAEHAKQLALRCRAETCELEELLAENIELRAQLAAAEAENAKLRKHLEETTDVVICEFADETTDQQHNTGWWVCGACWNARAKESAS